MSPTSLQNALNTSAYVIFYEMVKTSRNQIVAPSPVKPKTPTVPEKKIIGPQLPPSSNGSVAKVAPSPRAIPISPNPKLVKPKVISEHHVEAKKITLKPVVLHAFDSLDFCFLTQVNIVGSICELFSIFYTYL